MGSGFEVIYACHRCGPFVWHAKPEDCPGFGLGFRIPIPLRYNSYTRMSVPTTAAKAGRPALEEPRDCTASTRLTKGEYDGLLKLVPRRGSVSDLIRELLSEALVARMTLRPSRNNRKQ